MSIFSQETGYPKSVHGPQSRVSLWNRGMPYLSLFKNFLTSSNLMYRGLPIGLGFTSSQITGSSGRGMKADCMIGGLSILPKKAGFLGGYFHESSSVDHRGFRRHRG